LPTAEELPRHHHPLDLVRPLVDLGDLGVAHHPLDRVVTSIAVSEAMVLAAAEANVRPAIFSPLIARSDRAAAW
jgi:hypothetical protein